MTRTSTRNTTSHFVTLTFANQNLILPEARRLVKRLANALRDKARKEGWKYIFWLRFCNIDPRSGKQNALHVHLVITGNPGCTIAKWMKSYWELRNGYVHSKKIRNAGGFAKVNAYIDKQSVGRPWKQNLGDPGTPDFEQLESGHVLPSSTPVETGAAGQCILMIMLRLGIS